MKLRFIVTQKVLLLIILLMLTACNNQTKQDIFLEQEINFEVIDENKHSLYNNATPALILVSTPQEISTLTPYIYSEITDVLKDIDFNHYIVASVFQGHKSGGPAGVIVEKVTFENSTVKVYATFIESEGVTQPMEMSAYQVVQIEKTEELIGKNVIFILVANGKKVIERTYIL